VRALIVGRQIAAAREIIADLTQGGAVRTNDAVAPPRDALSANQEGQKPPPLRTRFMYWRMPGNGRPLEAARALRGRADRQHRQRSSWSPHWTATYEVREEAESSILDGFPGQARDQPCCGLRS